MKRKLISIILMIVAAFLLSVTVVMWPQSQRDESNEPPSVPPPVPGVTQGSITAQPTAYSVPINDVDPLTGKSVGPNSPTTLYKGYTIGFCCTDSPGYNGSWAGMSEIEKDAFVARFVRDRVASPSVAKLTPINNVDPMTGKPIGPDQPTTFYKGYTIGFCCTKSEAYNGGWARMSEAEKDAFIARFVK
ncbi:MAG: hypothetical protein IIB54_15520 [Planctomycetes bacterium]|nr:hypothetical protein [Planctomycetota bacterium]